MVFNATFNNLSAISWRLLLLVVETEVPGENHRPVASHWQTLSNVVLSIPNVIENDILTWKICSVTLQYQLTETVKIWKKI
jgi:hypothetical protein